VHGSENMHRVGAQIPGAQLHMTGPISIKRMQYKALE
jgi:hypothetical protein